MQINMPITNYIANDLLTTRGDILFRGAVLNQRLAGGTPGQALLTQGAIADPAFNYPKQLRDVGNVGFLFKLLDIGVWDMDTDAAKDVVHGLSAMTILSVTGVIYNDILTTPFIIGAGDGITTFSDDMNFYTINSTQIQIKRAAGSYFDSVAFDDGVINRGKIFIAYTF